MSRPIGLPKTGGRVKGTPNRRTLRISEALEHFAYDPVKALLEKYPNLLIDDQLRIDMRLLDFVYSKPKGGDSEIEQASSIQLPEDPEARKALHIKLKTERYESSFEAVLDELRLMVKAKPELLEKFKPEFLEELNLK